MFPGVVFDLYTATGLYFVSIAIINYFIIYIVMALTPLLLTNILTFVIIGGVVGAMVTNRENQWWQHKFSFFRYQRSDKPLAIQSYLSFSDHFDDGIN